MPISSPLPTDTRSKLCDWIEVLCLATTRRTASRADLLSLFDLLGEDREHELELDDVTGEPLEGEILEDARAFSADTVLDELQYRSEVLGSYYPFNIHVRGQQWRISRVDGGNAPDEERIAQECYVFCLLTSAIRDKSIQGVNLAQVARTMALHFQNLAAEAAADVIGGSSISFGWPRPEGTAFRPALTAVSESLGLGKPLEAAPLWSSGREKDAGIDVIAWKDFADLRPGKLVILGQVASGHDWTDKTVKTDTPQFLSWFSARPMEHYIPAIFIPFPQHHSCTGKGDAAFEAVANAEAWLREQEFGLVVDRLRIVGAAARQILRVQQTDEPTMLTGLNTWIDEAMEIARAAG